MADLTRAGHFVTQPTGYSAFMPEHLPPQMLVWDASLRDLEVGAAIAVGRLDGITRMLPDPGLFLYMYVRKEAVLSSQIEGTQSSLSDLLLFEEEHAPAVPSSDVVEVSRYVRALEAGVSRLKELPLSMRVLREVHSELLTGARGGDKTPGDIRTSQNWIGGTNLTNALFVPPPAYALPELLTNLERFLHDNPERTPPLVKAGLAHAQFETIHPFLDGNGRVGRLLITLTLLAEKVLHSPLLYMSLHFKERREEYYTRLQRIRTHGEWEAWLRFFLEGVVVVADSACKTVEDVTELFRRDRAKIEATAGRAAGNALRVFDHARERALITIPNAAAALGLTPPTVTAAVALCEKLGVLKEITQRRRDRRYVYNEYINILNAGSDR